MKIQELSNLSREELLVKEKTLKGELFKLNQQRYGGRVEKPHMFSLLKRDIARIRTILNTKTRIRTDKGTDTHG
ncbi:MAG: 50S ribosomal protein L29 [Candidatus Omnitrophica bacterium]|nr:50S ribosomal protein L29 [Candidatus Omnitrophota bacterium]